MLEKRLERLKQDLDMNDYSYREMIPYINQHLGKISYKSPIVKKENTIIEKLPKHFIEFSIFFRVPILLYKKRGYFRSIGLLLDYYLNNNTNAIIEFIHDFKYMFEAIQDSREPNIPLLEKVADFLEKNAGDENLCYITKSCIINEEFFDDMCKFAINKSINQPKDVLMFLLIPALEANYAPGVQSLVLGNPIGSIRYRNDLQLALSEFFSNKREKIFMINNEIVDALLKTDIDDDKEMIFVFPFDDFKVKFLHNYYDHHGDLGIEAEIHIIKKSLLNPEFPIIDPMGDSEYLINYKMAKRDPNETYTTFHVGTCDISSNMIMGVLLNASKASTDLANQFRKFQNDLFGTHNIRTDEVYHLEDSSNLLAYLVLMFLSTRNVKKLLDETQEERKKCQSRSDYLDPNKPTYITLGLTQRVYSNTQSDTNEVIAKRRMHEVKRYFKMQHYGEGMAERRLTWIEPYIRGSVESMHTQIYMVKE